MVRPVAILAGAAAFWLGISAAAAQEKLKVGVIATLSGPPAVLGQQLRNGFQLAVKHLGGKLGGREARIPEARRSLGGEVAPWPRHPSRVNRGESCPPRRAASVVVQKFASFLPRVLQANF